MRKIKKKKGDFFFRRLGVEKLYLLHSIDVLIKS